MGIGLRRPLFMHTWKRKITHVQFACTVHTVCLWQLRSQRSAPAAASCTQVVYKGLRPQFPRGVDPQYQRLAERCWATAPGDRPSAERVRVLACVHACMHTRAGVCLETRYGG